MRNFKILITRTVLHHIASHYIFKIFIQAYIFCSAVLPKLNTVLLNFQYGAPYCFPPSSKISNIYFSIYSRALPLLSIRSRLLLTSAFHNVQYILLQYAFCLPQFSIRSSLILPSIFKKVQYGLKYFCPPSSKTYSEKCSIIALRLPKCALLRTETVKQFHETIFLRTIWVCAKRGYKDITSVYDTKVLSTATMIHNFIGSHNLIGDRAGF